MTNPARLPAAGRYLHMLEAVRFEEQDWPETGSILVQPVWKGVDRPDGTGVALRPSDRALAERLRDAILRGDAYGEVETRTDATGRTYVSAEHRFSAVELAQDLDTLDRIGPLAGSDPSVAIGRSPVRRGSKKGGKE